MKIIVDGNDGLGKSTLVKALLERGIHASDRGIPTKMTDNPNIVALDGEFYLILDAPIEISRARLEQAGKDLTERYHTVDDLRFYRDRFQEVARRLNAQCVVINAAQPPEHVLSDAMKALQKYIP